MLKKIFNKEFMAGKSLIGVLSIVTVIAFINAISMYNITLYTFMIAIGIIVIGGIISYLVGSIVMYVIEKWIFDL
jgi:hypothetical protein